MPLIFSAFCPHPPILIPAIGQSNLKKLRKTQKSLEHLARDLYQAAPETIIIISPHAQISADNFLINHEPNLLGDFMDFGDLENKLAFKNDLGLAYKIKEDIETQIPLMFYQPEKLDYSALVPLYYLTKELKNFSIIPLSPSLLDNQTHFNLGSSIKEVVAQTNKRVAIIASGDLSHRLAKDSPAGYSPQGLKFDKTLIKLLENGQAEKLINLDSNLIKEAGECGLRSLLILLGALDQYKYQMEILSYQSPFGVGYLTAHFKS